MTSRALLNIVAGVSVVAWLLASPAISVNAQTSCSSPAGQPPQAPQGLRIIARLLSMPILSAQALSCLPTAANTGLTGAGISESGLTSQGAITYGSSFN